MPKIEYCPIHRESVFNRHLAHSWPKSCDQCAKDLDETSWRKISESEWRKAHRMDE